jgi:hypothetical protein
MEKHRTILVSHYSKEAPCRECKERHTACHDSCEKYLSWQEEKNSYREKERRDKNAPSETWSYTRKKEK